MSEARPPAPKTPDPAKKMDSSIRRAGPTSVIIRPVPSIVFLWPTCVAALVSALIMHYWGDNERAGRLAAHLFYIPLAFNFLVLAFAFSRAKVITILIAFVALVFLAMYLNVTHPDILDRFLDQFRALKMQANAAFYSMFAFILAFVYLLVFISTRFNYWEITNNELIHHHGMLGDVERFPAPNLRISKEIDDVFQWLMSGSGRLVFYVQEQEQAIILDNVLGINHVENRIKELLSTLSVTMYHKENH